MIACEEALFQSSRMPRRPSQTRHRQWIHQLIALGRRWGWLFALPLLLIAALALQQEQLHVWALAAGLVCGALSFNHGRHYYQGGEESHWLLTIAFAFLGWPFLQLLEANGADQAQQSWISLQYFAAVLAVWFSRAWMEQPPEG